MSVIGRLAGSREPKVNLVDRSHHGKISAKGFLPKGSPNSIQRQMLDVLTHSHRGTDPPTVHLFLVNGFSKHILDAGWHDPIPSWEALEGDVGVFLYMENGRNRVADAGRCGQH